MTELNSIWRTCNPKSPLGELIANQLRAWPEHEKTLSTSFENRSERLTQITELAADLIFKMIDPSFQEHAENYKWFCSQTNEEVLYFLREGRYRHSTFQEVASSVYNNPPYMTAYMQGLLLSQLFWQNHTQVIDQYVNQFLKDLPAGSTFLEIGPGHGLLTALAAKNSNISQLEAWDMSPSSLEMTRRNLDKLGVAHRVQLGEHDISKAVPGSIKFDAIVLSEVLEHLEEPALVLKGIQNYLAPQGRVFINVPVNSPALDHIYLLKSPEETRTLVENAGFQLSDFCCFPATGYTVELARKRGLTISCVMTASLQRGHESKP